MKKRAVFVALFLLSSIFVLAFMQYSSVPDVYLTTPDKAALPKIIQYDLVDINNATKEELMTLDGVGEVLAERIIEYRTAGNVFHSVYELKKIKGIGDEVIRKNESKIKIDLKYADETEETTVSSKAETTAETTVYVTEYTQPAETSVTYIESATETVAVSVSYPLDINSATEEELCTISGIGSVLAGRIVEYRNESGGFRSEEELCEVKGIGEATLEKIRPYVYADTENLPETQTTAESTAPITQTTQTEQTYVTRYKVNLNTASFYDLKQLGISDELAENILILRGKILYFSNPLELLLADGMTNEIYNSISGYVYVE